MINKRYKRASTHFIKTAALNEIIDKGGEASKDAKKSKSALISNSTERRTRRGRNNANSDILDSHLILAGSYASGKRR